MNERKTHNKNLISISQLSRADIEQFIKQANHFATNSRGSNRLLESAIVGLLFFQDSIRTSLGFESAAYRLGAQVLKLDHTKFQDNMTAAESVEDTVRILNGYSDILCIRYPHSDIFSRVAPLVDKPLINAGNGDDEHPTQALIDLLAINNHFNRIDGLRFAMVGDLRYMRVAHSFLLALAKFSDVEVEAISPEDLKIPTRYQNPYLASGNLLSETEDMNLKGVDVVYVSGFAPKTPIRIFNDKERRKFQINHSTLPQLKKDCIILCPLPRIDEITSEVDQSKHARYFQQSDNGLFMRMSVLFKYTR